jgi:hypothetical protein
MNTLKRRLAKLERAAAPSVALYVWQEDGETKGTGDRPPVPGWRPE